MRRIRYAFCFIPCGQAVLSGQTAPARDNDFFVYVGTYTGFKYVHHSKPYGRGESHSKGIYVSRFHAATGELSPPELAAEMTNFGSGSVSVLRVREDGSLGELTAFIQDVGHSVDPSIQTEPHPHSIVVSPDNRYAIVSDLGLDKVLIFHFDATTGRLSPPDPGFAAV